VTASTSNSQLHNSVDEASRVAGRLHRAGSSMIATARTGAADAPRHFTGSTLTMKE
jgi:hypothetical protein